MPISDLSTAGFLTNDEISTPPIDPTAAEPWGARPTGGGFGPAAWSLGEGGIKTYVEQINILTSTMTGPRRCRLRPTRYPMRPRSLLYTQTGSGNSDDPFKLANFLKKGGKVIWYHGGSDSLITPFRSFWFYEQLASLHGGYGPTQDSVRMFIVPGMGHCGGGSRVRRTALTRCRRSIIG